MRRARATALALVNWKGVFYERYLLDRNVTALEGANGAGKTTVMIAAYVVLLPDLSRLRFTNLGESGATGGDKGIWGRLGEQGRPSYAALEVDLGAERVVAGVHLERKAEPSLELTPFLVSGLALQGSLKQILLIEEGEHDEVPELRQLRERVEALGGQFRSFPSAKDYFAALFELGVTPLRLSTDEDRNKMNEMLRTSMTGGISRALTSDLRNFLLKEETGLGDTLSRMRANLDACHRTRTEVSEARRLEHEINGVYDAGQALFSAALLALRKEAEEHQAAVDEAERRLEEAERALAELTLQGSELSSRQRSLEDRLAAARARVDEARARRERLERVQALEARVASLEAELTPLAERAAEANAARAEANARRGACKLEIAAAREAYDRAARGLGDVQSGLEELHRNAHLQRRLRRLLAELRSDGCELPETGTAEELQRLLTERSLRRAELEKERARLARDAQLTSTRRDEYTWALAALGRCVGEVRPGDAHAVARALLAETAELEHLAGRVGALAAERDRLQELAARQARVRAKAAEQGLEPAEGRAGVERILLEVDAALRSAQDGLRLAERAAQEARTQAESTRERIRTLDQQVVRWGECEASARRLDELLGDAAPAEVLLAGGALEDVRRVIDERREAAQAQRAAATQRRDTLLDQASQLETSGGLVSPALLELRDQLDAELLAGRFEELEPEEAARVEAQLGPLAGALVVRDPEATADALLDTERALDTVWLVSPDLQLAATDVHAVAGHDLIVRDEFGVRLTRIPERPTLGRRARERRTDELRQEAAAAAQELEEVLGWLRRLEAGARDLDFLLSERALLASGDPRDAARAAEEQLVAYQERERQERERGAALQQQVTELRERNDALRTLWGDALLLDPPDYGAALDEVSQEHQKAVEARERLARTAEDRKRLAELVDALRDPPPNDEELLTRAERLAELERETELAARQEEALTELLTHQGVVGGPDYEALLSERTEVVPALEAQHESARQRLEASEEALHASEEAWERTTTAAQKAEAELEAARAHLERVRGEIAAERVEDLSDAELLGALERAHQLQTEAQAELDRLEEERRTSAAQVALFEERRGQAAARDRELREALQAAQDRARPSGARWEEIRERARAARVLQSALSRRALEAYGDWSSVDLWAEARSKAALLIDRLEGARGGGDCAAEVRERLAREEDGDGDRYLAVWLTTRDWLKRRLPTQVAEVEDPVEALGQLRDHLAVLESRLQRQENDLRGASEDVARGIEVQLRRATAQVRRLGQHLEGVSFGSIAGIRVRMRRSERMAQVLEALREGAAQELLFQSSLPIEEALDEIFRRFGGGRTGGQRLLDYREYIELDVEVLRRSKSEWEAASPTRLSTGEAIGVGAALMMVVLTEWERDANLLRPRRDFGSLRFLFLDEANRLSQDNLSVLFDLCQNLDLQLLIAAPEVARAGGNTTYRLVRRVTEDGHEEVLVSGRRTEPIDALEPSASAGTYPPETCPPETCPQETDPV